MEVQMREVFSKESSSTSTHLDTINHDVMAKVNHLEATLAHIEQKSTENFGALRSGTTNTSS